RLSMKRSEASMTLLQLIPALRRTLLAVATTLLLAACGGGANVVNNPNLASGNPGPSAYGGPPPQTSDIQAFLSALWSNVRDGTPADCGSCHGAGGQAPQFAREDNVNLAYEAANTVANRSDPPSSQLVQKVAGGHHCWLGSDGASLGACADIIA